jgi:DNA-binding MarR family transcriptional regulator
MSELRDPVDVMRVRLAELHPDLDTAPFGVTGRVLRLAAWLERQRADQLEAFDLTPGDFDVLATIRRTEGETGVNPRELVAAVLITSGGLTKRLDRLESAGLIGRHPDPSDRRGTRVRLTPEGTDLIDRALWSVLTHEREIVAAALTERQVEQASTLLHKLTTTHA